jgi:hypothetical protein
VLNTSTYGIQLSVEVFGDNARGFGDDALLFLKEAPTKLITNNNTLQFKVYPSPANNLISIELNTEEEFQIEIIDVLGRVLYTNRIYKNMNVDISKFPKNMYFVKVYKGNQKAVKGFVKN